MDPTYQRGYWGFVFRFAAKDMLAGICIGTLLPQFPRRTLLAKTRAALELIADHDPRQFARLNQLAAGIFIFEKPGTLGTWLHGPKLILLSEEFIGTPENTDAAVACVIVHETTHAWLEARGIRYRPERRRRIEAICYRAEAAFARRLFDGAALQEHYEERAKDVLAQGDEDWSDAAFLVNDATRLRSLGVPEWLVEWFVRYKARRAA